jgi:hypothetical protein
VTVGVVAARGELEKLLERLAPTPVEATDVGVIVVVKVTVPPQVVEGSGVGVIDVVVLVAEGLAGVGVIGVVVLVEEAPAELGKGEATALSKSKTATARAEACLNMLTVYSI